MYCRHCGKEIGDAAWCPYCGTKQQTENEQQQKAENNIFSNYESQNAREEPVNHAPAPRTNIFALIGLIFAFFSYPIGIIFSCIGLAKAREYGSGKELAIAGIILGAVIGISSALFAVFAALRFLPWLEQALLEISRHA